jgi:ABC-type branched-subunit amino acid transport system substrate-binding protein
MRVVSPDTFQAKAWLAVLKHFGWKRISIISSNEEVHSSLVQYFHYLVETQMSSVRIIAQEIFAGNANANIGFHLENIKKKGGNIIFAACYGEDAVNMVCRNIQFKSYN